MFFSRRIPEEFSPSPLAERLDLEPASRFDLTDVNPTRCLPTYPHEAIAGALGATWPLIYAPHGRGLASAREALAARSSRSGSPVTPDRLVLTASTSEAYALVFKTFCDPGATVAAPRPSYPLIQHLAELEGLRVAAYDLHYERRRWRVDLEGARRQLRAGARVLVVVSPNNPTGSVATTPELAALRQMCAEHDVPLVVDQVFADYGLELADVPRAGGEGRGLTLVLDGLSKHAGMPHLKLAWIAAHGDDVEPALARLEWVNDMALSAAGPVQAALPRLLEIGDAVRSAIADQLRVNLTALRALVSDVPAVELLPIEAGWYAMLRVPRVLDDDELVLYLARAGVRVQPGYLYDVDERGVLVLSLLPHPGDFAGGCAVLKQVCTSVF